VNAANAVATEAVGAASRLVCIAACCCLVLRGPDQIRLPCREPKGAFCTFPSFEHTSLTSEQSARRLLFEEAVAAVPSSVLGDCGAGYLWCIHATGLEQLKETLVRIERLLEKLARGEVVVPAAPAPSC